MFNTDLPLCTYRLYLYSLMHFCLSYWTKKCHPMQINKVSSSFIKSRHPSLSFIKQAGEARCCVYVGQAALCSQRPGDFHRTGLSPFHRHPELSHTRVAPAPTRKRRDQTELAVAPPTDWSKCRELQVICIKMNGSREGKIHR